MNKKYTRAQQANQSVVYGALLGIIKDPDLWRHSSVSREYSKLTDNGRMLLVDIMEELMREIDILDTQSLEEKAKELVLETLSKS